jgi:hypothetical protein
MISILELASETPTSQPAWWQLLIAAIGGGVIVKLLDVLYLEIRRVLERRTTVEDFVQSKLDPILKAADELVGKVYALAQEDFLSITDRLSPSVRDDRDINLSSTLYLFVQLWGTIEILRRESLYVRLASSPSGGKLTGFIRCLESRRVRLVVRARQRALGESLIVDGPRGLRLMGYSEFMTLLSRDKVVEAWIMPLAEQLIETKHGSREGQKSRRQLVLQYALILHAMIDTLDSAHTTTKDRPPQTTKLAPLTQRGLRSRVFPVYLSFVKEIGRYTGAERR